MSQSNSNPISRKLKGLKLNSYAKLNLYLAVLNKRRDNYHNIKTIFERIDLCDRIVLKPRCSNRIKITSNSSLIPRDETNLVYRSVQLLKDAFKIKTGMDIRIIKRIPVGAGLGGGSSNAAAVLVALNKIWGLQLTRKRLVSFARKIGADVPFFIFDTPFAQGENKGDSIRPLEELKRVRLRHIVVVPRFKVSTPLIYKKWDKIPQKARLTIPKSGVKMLTSALRRMDMPLIGKRMFNSLETVTLKVYPEVRNLKERLMRLGMKSILMSGSGPAVFGILSSGKEAASLGRQLGRSKLWQVFVTRTI
jgi:4-diphosphocytidyl-2-C-methyl-D-erythritol kinase